MTLSSSLWRIIREIINSCIHVLRLFGLFELTPVTPPIAPETTSRSSFFNPARLPVKTIPNTRRARYSKTPHIMPSMRPFFRLCLPQKKEPEKAPVKSGISEIKRIALRSLINKNANKAVNAVIISVDNIPTAAEAIKLSRLFVHML